MDTITRTTKQIGDAIKRIRRQRNLAQEALGQKIHARQATISKLEAGEPATQLRTLMNTLAALDLELDGAIAGTGSALSGRSGGLDRGRREGAPALAEARGRSGIVPRRPAASGAGGRPGRPFRKRK
jgi:HTH-type transcriptional regulator / antitoxin HipB